MKMIGKEVAYFYGWLLLSTFVTWEFLSLRLLAHVHTMNSNCRVGQKTDHFWTLLTLQ